MTALAIQATDAEPQSGQRHPGGAPIGNRNRMRHGLTGTGVPPGSGRIERRINEFRRTLEDHVLAAHGQVTLEHALAIDEAYRWERHAALASRWLYKHATDMTHQERLQFSREAARATSERNKAVASLKLNGNEADVWASLQSALEVSNK